MRIFALFIALYLLLGSCFPGSDYSQLGKIKGLIEHYQEHKALAGSQETGFFEFLQDHFFSTGTHEHSDEKGHADLPFYQLGNGLTMVHLQYSLPVISFSKLIRIIIDFPYLSAKGLQYVALVFQPPIF